MLCWGSWNRPLMLHNVFCKTSVTKQLFVNSWQIVWATTLKFSSFMMIFLLLLHFHCIFLLYYQILALPLTMFPLLHIVFPFCYTTCAFVLFNFYLLTYLYFFIYILESLWAFEKLSFEIIFSLKDFFLEPHFCYRKVL